MKQNKLFNIILNGLIYVTVSLLLAVLLDRIFIINRWGHDDFEHLLSSMYIHNGYRPYLDYFQHHHPLLWYLLSPLFGIVKMPVNTYYIARILMAFVWGAGCLFMGLIIKKLGGSAKTFLYAMLIYLTFAPCHGIYIQTRPDTFMITCLLAGVYFWIVYVQNQKLKDILISYFLFWLSFAFLQKAVWFLFPFGCYQVVLLFQKKLKLSDFLYGLILPVLLTLGYLGYLYQTGALIRYWELNWVLNAYWFRDYRVYTIDVITILYTVSTVLSLIYISFKKTGIVRSLSLVSLGFMLIFLLIQKPYEFYWLMPAVVSSITLGSVLNDLLNRKRIVRLFAVAFLLYSIFMAGLYLFIPASLSDVDWKTVKKVYAETPKGEIIGSYGDFVYSFDQPYPHHYYYFSLERGALWDIDLFHRHELPDWNEIIYREKPLYVLGIILLNCKNTDNDNCQGKLMGVEKEFLMQNYKMLPNQRIWKRKW